MKPTPEQMEHFYDLQRRGVITRANLQAFLQHPDTTLQFFRSGGHHSLLVEYDQSIGLNQLIRLALGPNYNIIGRVGRITEQHYPLKGKGLRQVKCRVLPYSHDETDEQAYERLKDIVPGFANTGDLAAFLYKHPNEVEAWRMVVAISEDSRRKQPFSDTYVEVPTAAVRGENRSFLTDTFRDNKHGPDCGILVLCE